MMTRAEMIEAIRTRQSVQWPCEITMNNVDAGATLQGEDDQIAVVRDGNGCYSGACMIDAAALAIMNDWPVAWSEIW